MLSKFWEYLKKPFALLGAIIAGLGLSYLFGRCHGKKNEKNKNLLQSFEKEKIAQSEIEDKRLEIDTLKLKDSKKLNEILSERNPDKLDELLCDWARDELQRK